MLAKPSGMGMRACRPGSFTATCVRTEETILSHQTLIHRALRRPVSLLVTTPVTPDALTLLRLVTGLAAAACVTRAGAPMAIGAGLFLLSALLDRADGELARQTRRFSRFGFRFDLISDCIATSLIFIGLGFGAASSLPLGLSSQPLAGPMLGLSGAVSTVLTFGQLAMEPPNAGTRSRSPVIRNFDPDDAILVVPIAIWCGGCGGCGWILLACGVLTPLAAIGVGLSRLMRRRRLVPVKLSEQV